MTHHPRGRYLRVMSADAASRAFAHASRLGLRGPVKIGTCWFPNDA